jgi:hypothetical protein
VGALFWALVGALVTILVAGSHFAGDGGTYGSILARSLFVLLGSDALAATSICFLTVRAKNGWLLSAILMATAAFAIWLSLRVTSGNSWLDAATSVGVPGQLVASCICYGNISSGKIILDAPNPSGRAIARVDRTSSGDCVLLSGGLNLWSTCVFQIRGGVIQLQWSGRTKSEGKGSYRMWAECLVCSN